MWGQREFLDSSSSEEEPADKSSCRESCSTDYSHNENIRFIPKPPPSRPITTNPRILSIQRQKLLDRGSSAIRVQTSPFYRTNAIETGASPIAVAKKVIKPFEDLEEIKISDTKLIKPHNVVKEFLAVEKVESSSLFLPKPENTRVELVPQPKRQRINIPPNSALRSRPQSQNSGRRSSKHVKNLRMDPRP